VAKKARDKEPILDILVSTGGCHWELSQHWRANHIGVERVKYTTESYINSFPIFKFKKKHH